MKLNAQTFGFGGGMTEALIKGALKIMAWTKAKTAIVVSVVVLFTAGTTTLLVDKVARYYSLRQRLSDGLVLVLDKVSYGERHEFVHGGKEFDWNTPGEKYLVVEFHVTGESAASNSLVKPAFYRQFRCVIHGETGINYAEAFWSSEFKKYPDGFFNYFETSIFPRNSKWLWFRVEKSATNNPYGPWQTVADFKVPNPARGQSSLDRQPFPDNQHRWRNEFCVGRSDCGATSLFAERYLEPQGHCAGESF